MTTTQKKFRKVRLHKLATELNQSVNTIVDHLTKEGHASALSGKGLNASITDEGVYLDLLDAFATDMHTRERVLVLRAARQAEMDKVVRVTEPEVMSEETAPAEQDVVVIEVGGDGSSVPVQGGGEEELGEEVSAPEMEEEGEDAAVSEEMPAGEVVEEVVEEVAEEVVDEVAEEVVDEVAEEVVDEVAEEVVDEVGEEVVEEVGEEVVEEVGEEVVEEVAEEVVDEVAEEVVDEVGEEVVEEVEKEVVEEVGEEVVEEVGEEVVEEVEEVAASAEPEKEVKELGDTPEVEEAKDAETSEDAAPGTDEKIITADRYKLQGTTVVGTIDLAQVTDKESGTVRRKRKRKRKTTTPAAETKTATPASKEDASSTKQGKKRNKRRKPKVDTEEVQQTLQDTLRELDQGPARVRQRRRRARRLERAEARASEKHEKEAQEKVIRVTEFVSTGELARLMDISATEVIGMLFNAGMMVSINQRLDADTISFVTDDFGYEVEFITEFGNEDIVEMEEDHPDSLVPRAPVVTVMGHVDHGKTSLLDNIRNANVAVGETGGITQHIGAYQVTLPGERQVTFLDTPGHEAFTAMRARGAKVTDIVILVVAADDAVMPQTVEAINHARAAEVPIVVAINKVDLPDTNVQRVTQQLSDNGVLVEQYGGKVQCTEVSAKTGQGINDLLEKVLLEAELMELQGNPDRRAQGVVIESRLDKGRGNVATVLVQNGTLEVGDPFVAGIHGGRVRAMFDEWDQKIQKIGSSEPALVLGLQGQPNVGDPLIGFDTEGEAREVAQRRQQIYREQKLRQYKHVRLEDIGRRMALGDFSELNLIIKGDVGGSVEAVSDSLQKLSTDEVAVNIIHSGVGAINESDVMLASASDAVIIGFQVRPTAGARAAGEREEIDIHTYSIIYKAIEDIRDALEGMLTPEETEKINGVAEVRELFRVPKAGTVAGSYVSEGKIRRKDTVHVLRESVVIYNGKLSSLKRFKEDVREVVSGYECGIGIENFNDLKVGDQIEAYVVIETKRTLEV